jgi:U3 small nucleolar RNA-associated protein 6
MQYATLHVDANDRKTLGDYCIRNIACEYLATARVWAKVFSLEVENGDDHRLLQQIYELWGQKDKVAATVAWGRWLLLHGRGKEATEVVVRARSSLKETERMELEKKWTVILDEVEEDGDKVVEE